MTTTTSSESKCDICGASTHHLAQLCKRCKKIRDRIDMRRRPNKEARTRALRLAWDGEAFRCYYTGVRLADDDPSDPRYMTFDHRTPRDEDDVVLCAACINDMKSDLSEEEFRAVVLALAARFNGGEFDERALQLKHYRRSPKPETS